MVEGTKTPKAQGNRSSSEGPVGTWSGPPTTSRAKCHPGEGLQQGSPGSWAAMTIPRGRTHRSKGGGPWSHRADRTKRIMHSSASHAASCALLSIASRAEQAKRRTWPLGEPRHAKVHWPHSCVSNPRSSPYRPIVRSTSHRLSSARRSGLAPMVATEGRRA
jgi:hypothetical protein